MKIISTTFFSTQLSGPTAIPMELDLSIIPTENPVLADISCNLASQVNKNSDASSLFDKSTGEPCPTKKSKLTTSGIDIKKIPHVKY